MSSPTQRTLAELRKLGYLAAVVERWNPHAKIRQDLFGFVDVVAVGCPPEIGATGPHTLAVQATSGDHVAHRIEKIAGTPELAERADLLKAAGWRVEVWGWRKNSKGRWILRREAL